MRDKVNQTMTKPILILQLRPEDETSDSEFDAILKYGGLRPSAVERLRIETKGIPERLSLDDYAAVIIGGSPFDISTPEAEKSAVQKKIEQDIHKLLDEVVARDFPFLGACSGNGFLGAYLQTPITRKYGEPVGVSTVTITEAGKQDSLLEGFPEQIDVLLGHKEACDYTPNGATLLISGEQCPVQMFRVGQNVYATQFHPEGDCEGFTVRINAYKDHGYFEPHEAEALVKRLVGVQTPHAQEILRRFVQRVYQLSI